MFGAELAMLIDEETVIPIVIEKLLMMIELRALYVEGVYRKSGSVAQVRQLRKIIETTPSIFHSVLILSLMIGLQISTPSVSKTRLYTSYRLWSRRSFANFQNHS